ncbi:MAG: ABC transporter permease [Bdellovibrionales bacterium]|nr:ABC transporter permease [Bdellovibrionales bacterium]
MELFLDLLKLPDLGMGFWRIWERNLLIFKANLMETALTVVIEPLIFYWALAYGLGQYVDVINGLSFVEYLFPGFMVLTAMSISYAETSHTCYLRITPNGDYSNYQYTPMRHAEVALGEILWATFKGMLGGLSLAVFAFQQGFFEASHWPILLLILTFISLLFSSLGLLVMTQVKSYEAFSVAYAVFLLPMFLLSGALFPLDALPQFYSYLSMAFPVTHGLLMLRSAFVEIYDTQFYLNLSVVVLVALLICHIAIARFEARFRR